MGVRLTSLKASAELDAAKYKTGAAEVAGADAKMKASQAGVATAMTQTQTRASESARSFDKYRQSLDPVYRAQVQVEAGARRLAAGLQAGNVSAVEHALLMSKLQAKYADAGVGATRLQASVGGLYGAFGNLRGVLAGVGALFVAREYFQFADTMSGIASKLRLVTDSSAELASVQNKLFAQSQETRSSFEATVQLYARVARNSDQLGLSQEKLFQITDAVNKAIKISGASTAEAASGVIQFSQALASGNFGGDEFKSLGENATRLTKAIADGLGLTIGELRKLSKEGKLSADLAVQGLLNQKDVINNEFRKIPATVGEAFTVANNNLLLYVGRVDEAAGASKQFGEAVTAFSGVLNDPTTIRAGAALVMSLGTVLELLISPILGAYGALRDFRALLEKPINLPSGPTYGDVAVKGLRNAFPMAAAGYDSTVAAFRPQPAETKSVVIPLRSVSDKSFYNTTDQVAAAQSSTSAFDDLSASIDKAGKVAEVAWPKIAGSSGGSGGGRGSGGGAKAAIRDVRGEMDKYLGSLEEDARLSKLIGIEREKEEAVIRLVAIGGKAVLDIDRQRAIAAVELKDAAVQQAQALEDQQQAAAASLEEARQRSQAFAQEVNDEAAGAISNFLERGKDGVDDFVGYWKRRFFELLADLAAKAIVTPIVMTVLQSSALGGVGANFGETGVGGVKTEAGALSGIASALDRIGESVGIRKTFGANDNDGAFGVGNARRPNPGETTPVDQGGIAGSGVGLSGAVGAAVAGIGIGSVAAQITKGNSKNAQIGGGIGGVIGGIIGGIYGGPAGAQAGAGIGSALGGFVGGLLGPKPTNATAAIKFDVSYGKTQMPFSKETPETRQAINQAADQITSVIRLLEGVGTTFNDRITDIAIGVRDPSYIQFEKQGLVRSPKGDPDALSVAAIQGLLKSASFESQSVAAIAKRNFGSVTDLTSALDFAVNTYDIIAGQRQPLGAVEQAMADLTARLKTARAETVKYGLSLDKLNTGATNLFNRDIGDQIRAIVDPVGLALDEFERGAVARVNVAKQLGADLVQVEKLNGLQRAQVVAQAQQQSVAGLKSLIDDLSFGGLSSGVAPEQQYFSALSQYNAAKRSALDSGAPSAVQDFETYARALVPIASSYLGVSTRFSDLRQDILSTAGTLSTPALDASTQAMIAATMQGSTSIVDAVEQHAAKTDNLREEFKTWSATLRAMLQKLTNSQAA